MSDVKINIIVNGDNVGAIDAVSGKLKELGTAAASAGEQTKMSLTDIKSGFDIMSTAVRQAVGMIDDVNNLGTAWLRTHEALNSLSGGQADQFLSAMRTATHGLVDDMDLARQATKALGLGIVSTAEDAAKLSKYGAILGQNFLGNASQGVETLTNAIQRVGLVQLLDNVGLSGERVKKRFQELKGTMSDSDAWRMAVFEDAEHNVGKLEKSLDGAGSAVDRLKTRFENFASSAASNVAVGIEGIVGVFEAISNRVVMNWIGDDAKRKAEIQTSQGSPTPLNSWGLPTSRKSGKEMAAASQHKYDIHGEFDNINGKDMGLSNQWQYIPRVSGVKAGDDYMFETINHKMGAASDQQMQAAQALRSAADKQEAAAAAQERASSVKGAFGLNQAGIYGETGNIMLDSMNAARNNFAQKQKNKVGTGGWTEYASADDIKKYDEQAKKSRDEYAKLVDKFVPTGEDAFKGTDYKAGYLNEYDSVAKQKRDKALRQQGGYYTKKQADRAIEQYDREMQQAQDAYQLATGGATKESLKFRDAQNALNAAFEKGKMGPMEYTKHLIELTDAAKDGYASLKNLDAIMLQNQFDAMPDLSFGKDKKGNIKQTGGNMFSDSAQSHLRDAGKLGVDKSSATGKTADDPFKPVGDSANKAQKEVDKLNEATGKVGSRVPAMGNMFDSMKPAAAKALVELNKVEAKKMQVAKTITARINIVATVNGKPTTP